MTERAHGEALARVAKVLADPSRATMLIALLDGRAWTAGELARAAHIARSTATEHLHALAAEGLTAERRQGRHRYVRITDQSTAAMVEMLSTRTGAPSPRASWHAVDAHRALRSARTCFDHIAGALGTGLCDMFENSGLLEREGALRLSATGRRWCATHGVDVDSRSRSRRPEVLLCLDWTERRDHLAGAVGAAILETALRSEWVKRVPNSRALTVTQLGRAILC